MAIPANLELAAHGERPRSSLARFYLEHERLAIGGGTLVAVLLLWEALGRSGLVDPLFISFPTQVAQAGWQLSHDRDFWNDVEVSASEFILGYGAALALAIPLGLAVGLSKRLQYMIFTGLKYGAGRALLGVVVGELYASTAGLGHMIADAGNTFQTDIVFFGVLVFMATGLIVVALLDAVERQFEKWRPHPR